ncbi:hypothetical protein OHB26_38860 (plasmid) [Nocardia sp. NBC_01503]|uniref:hypothetical protein n=1 Tax=Nocardia sp. NBC_01503 TaxID=2975997 RepID=UPI002E7ABF97|nr:hypothetical protein [Nocardia sp. NBC_01503]WTL36640.1 hypothetical protein OHB26_38860 [Nocardia sp. NBC_01503]
MQPHPLVLAPPARLPARYLLLRHRTARVLRELGVQPSDSADTLISALAQRLGCAIDVDSHPFKVPGFFGGTICTSDGYQILVQSETSGEHQTHIAMHEIAHILLGTTDSAAQAMYDGTHRTGDYSNPEERDAEFVARTITTWVRSDLDARLPAQPDDRAAAIARSLEDRISWS